MKKTLITICSGLAIAGMLGQAAFASGEDSTNKGNDVSAKATAPNLKSHYGFLWVVENDSSYPLADLWAQTANADSTNNFKMPVLLPGQTSPEQHGDYYTTDRDFWQLSFNVDGYPFHLWSTNSQSRAVQCSVMGSDIDHGGLIRVRVWAGDHPLPCWGEGIGTECFTPSKDGSQYYTEGVRIQMPYSSFCDVYVNTK